MSALSRKEQKERTRQHIIAIATERFAQDGINATKTADIAACAGVSHGTIFAHFPTRDILLGAVIDQFGLRVSRRLHELASQNVSLRDVLEAHLQGLIEFEPFYTRLVTETSFLSVESRNTLVLIQSAIASHLIQAAEAEWNAGTLRRLEPHLFFNTWIGLIHYYLTNRDLFAPGASVLQRYGETLLTHYLGLLKP